VEDSVWENRKKANALPGAGVFHTAEQLAPRLFALRGAFFLARCFTVIPGWFRESYSDQGNSSTLVRLALPRPPNLEMEYCPVRGCCQEKIAKSG